MCVSKSQETYLEAIYSLSIHNHIVLAIDIACYLGYSKPSVSLALKDLEEKGYVYRGLHNVVKLTVDGEELAKQLFDQRCYFYNLLVQAGIDRKNADQDAQKLMHAVSIESFHKLKSFIPSIHNFI